MYAFGTGVVPPLNAALPPGTPPAQLVPDRDPHEMNAGDRLTIENLSPGTHKFMCLIHPWMRSTVTQR